MLDNKNFISQKRFSKKKKMHAVRLVMFLVSMKEVCMNDDIDPKGIRYHMSGFVFG